MDPATDIRRRVEIVKDQDPFRGNALKIITQMLEWSSKVNTPGSKHLVDEILHSILFLGGINIPPFTPEQIFDNDMQSKLREKYPRPLECYRSQLPKRSPFSCVLEMIVLKEEEDVDKIKECVREFTVDLEDGYLVSTTMCVTTCKESKHNYYGVSMSTNKKNSIARKIMIAAFILTGWEEYVAGAVMTYYPENARDKYKKKEYFDGTIKLPLDEITCQAFNIKNQTNMEPCRSCGNLFGLHTQDTKEYPYGNCAEVESVSNLLKNESAVKVAARPTCSNYTENRQRAKDSVLVALQQFLRIVKFFEWEFYEPETPVTNT